jgi:membrane associated rhomboid family serine protease
MQAPITNAILILTALATFFAFRRPDLEERWIFNPYAILAHKEYYRMLTSGFIHLNWVHFAVNAFSFYNFARLIEILYGAGTLLVIYGASIIGGSLLSLFIHRHHDYRALGASGGVCGLIFASIFLLPGSGVMMYPLPISVPGYVYAPIFLVVSFVAHRRQIGNIGHDAHVGGAMVGLLAAAAMYPRLILAAPYMFAGVLVVSAIVLLFLIRDPLGIIHNPLDLWKPPSDDRPEPAGGERVRRYRENARRNQKLAEMDRLLDRVAQNGIESLSPSERRKLEQLSQELYGRDDSARSQ